MTLALTRGKIVRGRTSERSAAAVSIAFSAGGAVKTLKTTPLMTMEEAVQAISKAGAVHYQPAGVA